MNVNHGELWSMNVNDVFMMILIRSSMMLSAYKAGPGHHLEVGS